MAEGYIAEIRLFAGNFAPQNWMLCNGQMLPISQYTALFSLLGTYYGGNGQTTFGLPDLRGRMPVSAGQSSSGTSYALGQTGGAEHTTLTTGQMPMHSHAATASVNASARGDTDSPSGAVCGPFPNNNIYSSAPDNATKMNAGMVAVAVQATGGNSPAPTMSPYLALNYIICINGIYPTRP
jgi:microcystin-dependent protein